MVRAPCCEKMGMKRGPWSPEEDQILVSFIRLNGHGNWRALPKQAGLLRCGKSCRLRWTNYLRPDIKRGNFTKEEEDDIINLHHLLGNRWSTIAARLPGRTDNEIKNIWHTHLKKRLQTPSIPDTKILVSSDPTPCLVASPQQQQCSSGISTVTCSSTEKTTAVKSEEADYSSEYLSHIDESFWSEELSKDNVESTEKVNGGGDRHHRLSVEDDDSMDFWYNLFTRAAGDMPDLPDF